MKQVRQRKTNTNDFTYTWNVKNKTKMNPDSDAENRLAIVGVWAANGERDQEVHTSDIKSVMET